MDSPMDSSETCASHLMSTPVASKRMRRDERVNPFEKHLIERLHQPVWSPSVLSNSTDALMETPPQTTWAIHQMSILNPAKIEESPSTHQNETVLDAQTEAEAQAAIEVFFSTTEPIAPSPISAQKSQSNSTNCKSTNTELSFPPIMPKDFEQFLYSFNAMNTSPNIRTEEMNSFLMRGRKLDFTLNFNSDPEEESEGESDGDKINIDIDNSNGRTFNSPSEESSGGATSGSGRRFEFDNSVFVRSEDFGGVEIDIGSPLGTPIRG